jgi:hypothetical protein
MKRLHVWIVFLTVTSITVILPGTSAFAQSQTPGQVTKFDPSLNVVDSVITEDPSGNIGIGTRTPTAALDVATGNLNLAGNLFKCGSLFLHNVGIENTFLGQNAGNLTMVGQLNTGIGFNTLFSNSSGNNNTAIGTNALGANTEGCCNAAIGTNALLQNTTGSSNTAFGDGALYSNTTGFDDMALGRWALISNTNGYLNVAIGNQALQDNITGIVNLAIGPQALLHNTTGDHNLAIGNGALLNNNDTFNTAIGWTALFNSTGRGNTAVGFQALRANTSGSFNTAIGMSAGFIGSLGNVTNATAIGANAVVDASNKIRLGDANITVIEGQVPYTFTSDRNQKERFEPVDGQQLLRKLAALSVTSWNYIGHDPQQFRHYGPVAQEFFAAFGHDGVGTIGTPTTINSGDLEGILLIAVQALEKQNAELRTRIEALERVMQSTTGGVR